MEFGLTKEQQPGSKLYINPNRGDHIRMMTFPFLIEARSVAMPINKDCPADWSLAAEHLKFIDRNLKENDER